MKIKRSSNGKDSDDSYYYWRNSCYKFEYREDLNFIDNNESDDEMCDLDIEEPDCLYCWDNGCSKCDYWCR